ncbi:MAG: type II toxin-antitoxin system RelE/ParE family toxin [Bacillus sp. (in: Bacteria)]|nr:type II toxin-antitoxin system RelE/ParE family toxin [Bacillus sp. (in: firmicutes)]
MTEQELFELMYVGNVKNFEEKILYNAEQEMLRGKAGIWCAVADSYVRQLTIIAYNPYPEEYIENNHGDETPPSIKHLVENVNYENFFRWGFSGGLTGNHRIIFAIHNYHKVILLHYFNKKYNGTISRNDIIPAEINYENYCVEDPDLYL